MKKSMKNFLFLYNVYIWEKAKILREAFNKYLESSMDDKLVHLKAYPEYDRKIFNWRQIIRHIAMR